MFYKYWHLYHAECQEYQKVLHRESCRIFGHKIMGDSQFDWEGMFYQSQVSQVSTSQSFLTKVLSFFTPQQLLLNISMEDLSLGGLVY